MQVADFLGLLGGLALYSELLTDFERVGDHVLNIGQSYVKIYGKM